MPLLPDFQNFQKNYEAGKSQLVWQWIVADLETPVSAYLKLCGDEPNAFLLESVEGGAVLGRYSAIGFNPDLIWQYRKGHVTINGEQQDTLPLQSIRENIAACRIDVTDGDIPPMGTSGLFGYMGYDMIRLYEDIPDGNPDTLEIPDGIFLRPTTMVIFDNVKHMMCITAPVYHGELSARDAYDTAVNKINAVLNKLYDPLPSTALYHETELPEELPVNSNMSEGQYHDMVRKTVDYILAGEIFQAVLGQRFSVPFDLPAFDLYRSLRRVNPSPFLFYLNLYGFSLVGSSPEILVRVRDNTVTIRPIAGTRKRGKTPEEDRALREDLLADPKERAEHLMLLDLGRNDVGRVAEIGSVTVTEQFIIEYYSHVMHIVSNVEGKLRSDLDSLDALFAGFPAGTVSGAPKIRAMEIIDELEPERRSYYGGCVGYLSGNGDMDTCIALRTALVKDKKIYVQAGAGIVADSKPESEHQECVNKARAIIQAAELAVQNAQKARRQMVS